MSDTAPGSEQTLNGADPSAALATSQGSDKPSSTAAGTLPVDATSDATVDSTTAAHAADDDTEDTEAQQRGNVPYDRFKQKNDEWKATRAERDRLAAEKAELDAAWQHVVATPAVKALVDQGLKPLEILQRLDEQTAREAAVQAKDAEFTRWNAEWNAAFDVADQKVDAAIEAGEDPAAARAEARAMRVKYQTDIAYFARPVDRQTAEEARQQSAAEATKSARAKLLAQYPEADPALVDQVAKAGNGDATIATAKASHEAGVRAKQLAAKLEEATKRQSVPNVVAGNGTAATPKTEGLGLSMELYNRDPVAWRRQRDKLAQESANRKYGR